MFTLKNIEQKGGQMVLVRSMQIWDKGRFLNLEKGANLTLFGCAGGYYTSFCSER